MKLSLERYLFFPDQILPSAPNSPQALCVAMDKSKKRLSQGQLDQGPSFDDELLEHGMQVFACQTDSHRIAGRLEFLWARLGEA